MDKQWIVERSALIQRIELLESTIGEMKERELKIKRINDTLLHSLSANGEVRIGLVERQWLQRTSQSHAPARKGAAKTA